ncbi:MAG: hypothetical protein EOP02_15315, partial [Proteobacteria bacterium]
MDASPLQQPPIHQERFHARQTGCHLSFHDPHRGDESGAGETWTARGRGGSRATSGGTDGATGDRRRCQRPDQPWQDRQRAARALSGTDRGGAPHVLRLHQCLSKSLGGVGPHRDPYGSAQSTDAQLDGLQEQGIQVAIGGLSLEQAVKGRGLHYIMSDADADAAFDAIDEALHLLRIEQERLHKRLELQGRYEMIRSILDCVSEGIFSIDSHGVITNMNSVATHYLGSVRCGDNVAGLLAQDYFGRVLGKGEAVRGALINLGRLSLTLSIAPITLGDQVIGAVATLQKQTEIKAIEQKMRRQLARQHVAENTFASIIGSSQALAKAKRLAQTFAAVDSTVMIEGETGTGKELFAQSIHNASKRRHGPFVAINCAAFAPGVLESELFGYVKGAFTGALTEGKAGVFELAHTGTIFLDEISETSAEIQLKLLRTLQERKVVR